MPRHALLWFWSFAHKKRAGCKHAEAIEEVSLPHSPACLLGGWKSHAEIIRSSLKRKSQVIPRDHLFANMRRRRRF